jgi:hypothetical protein
LVSNFMCNSSYVSWISAGAKTLKLFSAMNRRKNPWQVCHYRTKRISTPN